MTTDTATTFTIAELQAAVAQIIGCAPDDVAPEANLIQLGLDSLGMMRLVTSWRRQGVRVSSRDLLAQPTLAAWQRHLESLRLAALRESAL